MNTITHLFRADDTLFLDLTALSLVRFEGGDEDTTAHLRFKDGASETASGEAARNLQQYLIAERGEIPAPVPPEESVEVVDQPSASAPVRLHITSASLMGRNKAWFYGRDIKGRILILAFVNAKGSCSVRPFDGETGIAFGTRYGSGPYQEQFADLLEGATELTVEAQPNLARDCKQRLPDHLFSHLRDQINRTALEQ